MTEIEVEVNGRRVKRAVEPNRLLIDFIRQDLGADR